MGCTVARTNRFRGASAASAAARPTHSRTNTSRHVLMALTATADAHICSGRNRHQCARARPQKSRHTGVSYKSDTRHV